MSIEGIANYEFAHLEHVRPVWERLERIDYCDQPVFTRESNWIGRLREIFRKAK